jgi:hypothetical protein
MSEPRRQIINPTTECPNGGVNHSFPATRPDVPQKPIGNAEDRNAVPHDRMPNISGNIAMGTQGSR